MPRTAAEIMDPDFFYASQTDSIGQLLHDMAERGLASAPVLDLDGHPLGMATAREIDTFRRVEDLTEAVQHPAVSVHQNTEIEDAARTLAEHETDCLIVVDDHGVAVGALRALDLLRALLGSTVSHTLPAGSPPSPGTWSRGKLLDLESVHHAPAAPGIILLDSGIPDEAPNIVWAEATLNIRERLDQMLRMPQEEPELEALLDVYPRRLTFRSLAVTDAERRERLLRSLQALLARQRAAGKVEPPRSLS